MRLAGTLAVEAAGVPVVFDAPPSQTHRLVNFTGRVSVLTWQTSALMTSAAEARPPTAPAENLTFHVRGATLELAAPARETMHAELALAPHARVVVEGAAPPIAGVPSVLDAPDGRVAYAPTPGAAESVPWRWEPGWTVVGRRLGEPAFPSPVDPRLSVVGHFRGSFEGGQATLIVQGEPPRTWRTGTWQEGPLDVGDASAGARTETWRRLVLEGEAGSFDVRPGAWWTFAAPEVSWRLDGDVAWDNATGEARLPEGARRFEDRPVRGEGVVRVVPSLPRVKGMPVAYAAEGDWRSLEIGGASVASAPQGLDVAPAVGLSVLALALALLTDGGRALLGRLAGVLFTRFAPDELLDHETRRRILDEIRREPGIHLRELHRRVGGAWGSFDFHVGMLRQGGHVTARREGRYTALYRAGEAQGDPGLHHPVSLRILDLLPEDGAPVPLSTLRERAGVSRQLLAYHLKRLEEGGLARRDEVRREVARLRA